MKAGNHNYRGNSFILLYSPHPDVFVAMPPEFRAARHVAHASYITRGREKGISVYLLKTSDFPSNSSRLSFSRQMTHVPLDDGKRSTILERHGIKAKILSDAPEETLEVILKDVEVFDRGSSYRKTPKYPFDIQKVEKLVPNTTPKSSSYANIELLGKQDYVPCCKIDINLDLLTASCPTNLRTDGYYDPFGRCEYCYAQGQHSDVAIKRIKRVNKQSLIEQIKEARTRRASQGKQTNFIRFGKVSEPGSRLTREQLILSLEACIDTALSPIFTTKFLECADEPARLFKRTNAALMYSIGKDEFEPGAVDHGCTNEFRFEQAVKYHQEHRIKTALYVLIEATNFENHFFKDNLQKALALHEEIGIPVQLLPIRPTGKKLLAKYVGIPYRELLLEGHQDIFGGISIGSYAKTKTNEYYPKKIDQRFLDLIKMPGITMCHHTKQTTWCGGCLQAEPIEKPTEEANPPRLKRHKKKPKKNGQSEFKF